MMDKLDGSMLTRRTLPLWLGLLLLLAAVGLLVPLIYFAVRANSKACVDGLQAQKECQGRNQHLQSQLDQASREKKAEAATCNSTVVTLRESLKKEQAQVAKFQGELKILNQTLKDALADVERLRRRNENSSKNNASSCSSFLFVVIAVLVLNALLTRDPRQPADACSTLLPGCDNNRMPLDIAKPPLGAQIQFQ